MGTTKTRSSTASLLFGNVRTAVLALLFGHTDRDYYLREIVRATGAGQGAVQRELGRLVLAGVVSRTRRGRQVYYRANADAPIFAELRSLVAKTAGVVDVIRRRLESLTDEVDVAFVYGSVARASEAPESDVDLFVIGDISPSAVYEALWPAREELGREIDARVFSPREVRARLQNEDHFIRSVMSEAKLFVIGDADALRELGKPGQDR